MISCPVCNATNHHLAVTCAGCHAFLQGRSENLDLFSTAWELIERPRRALHTVAVARHKNYALFLSGAAGIAMAFAIFWLAKAGEHAGSLLNILAAGFALGPPFGIIVVLAVSLLSVGVAKLFAIRMSYRNTVAVFAYTLVPIVLSLIFVLPVEILTFGLFFFTGNPAPELLKPTSYHLLLALDGLFLLWTLILQHLGLRVLLDAGWLRTLAVQLLPLGAAAWLLWWGITTVLGMV